jgi:hypothetical protein
VAVLLAVTDGQPLAVYGPLGIALTALAWFVRELINRVIADKDQANEKLQKLTDQMMEQVMPVLHDVVRGLESRQRLDEQILEVLKDVRRQQGQVA